MPCIYTSQLKQEWWLFTMSPFKEWAFTSFIMQYVILVFELGTTMCAAVLALPHPTPQPCNWWASYDKQWCLSHTITSNYLKHPTNHRELLKHSEKNLSAENEREDTEYLPSHCSATCIFKWQCLLKHSLVVEGHPIFHQVIGNAILDEVMKDKYNISQILSSA